MDILIDTHVLLWWLADDEFLSETTRDLIADPSNEITISAASGWEIVIKRALGKLAFDGDLEKEIAGQGFKPLPVTFAHAAEISALPNIHRDPFDRMLVAQARIENLCLLTADQNILRYPVTTAQA